MARMNMNYCDYIFSSIHSLPLILFELLVLQLLTVGLVINGGNFSLNERY